MQRMTHTADTGTLAGLDVLTAVVTAGSFVRAADQLGLTQSGVSRAIARLEERVGVRLLDRTPRAVALTDDGRRIYAEVAPLLAQLGDAIGGAAGAAAIVRGRLRVNVDAFVARTILAPRIGPFLRAHPELEVEMIMRDTAGSLVAEGFDLAVRFGEPEASGNIVRRVLQTRIVTCATPAYLARMGRPKHPRDLAHGHTAIQFRDPQTSRPFPWEFQQGKRVITVPVSGPLVVNDVATAYAVCLAGDGIAQLKEIACAGLLRRKALVELFPAWGDERFPLYVIQPSRQHPPAKVRAFIAFVIAAIRAVPLTASGAERQIAP